jgi:hypothetical protein
MAVRDNALGIPKNELDKWVNMSLHAQRVGALPPYNELIGGKMVALTLVSNEVRRAYKRKYTDYKTILRKAELKPDLLFITTTSAFGKSSIYNRLKYNGDTIAERLGYTQGSGSFHILGGLYEELMEFLEKKGYDVSRGYGHGPSRKLKLISSAFREIDLPSFEYHGIKREFYLFRLVKNLENVIHKNSKPIWLNRSFDNLVEYWKARWAIPRAARRLQWKSFTVKQYFKKVKRILDQARSGVHGPG